MPRSGFTHHLQFVTLLYYVYDKKASHSHRRAPTPAPYLDLFAVYLDHFLAEVHPDGGLRLVGELPRTEAVGEAGLAHPRVADHYDFEDAGAGRRQGAGQLNRGLHLGHSGATGGPRLG